ncbi:hypothetical protein TNCV_1485411 [Trichonephila clavipes]|nr:hypothetical protein TNCV_1485411 [Trichonephila clavipes]
MPSFLSRGKHLSSDNAKLYLGIEHKTYHNRHVFSIGMFSVNFAECAPKLNEYSRDFFTCRIIYAKDDVDFLHHENPLTCAGIKPVTLGAEGQRCQVIYSQFGLAIHQNDHQARRRFVKWPQNEIAVVPDFHKRILFSDEANFWLKGYVNKQNCRIWSEANPQVYVETPLHPEKLTVWCAL